VGQEVALPTIVENSNQGANREEVVPAGSPRLLLVEDDSALRNRLAFSLEQAGYTVFQAGDYHAADGIALREGAGLHLAVVDLILPEMNGDGVVGLIRRRVPDVRVLYISGYTAQDLASRGVDLGSYRLLRKPFSLDALVNAVEQVLSA
jgi:two-component system, cell cycle sensor histidine kinase and response regulator CckA